jgi:hypothetical protein
MNTWYNTIEVLRPWMEIGHFKDSLLKSKGVYKEGLFFDLCRTGSDEWPEDTSPPEAAYGCCRDLERQNSCRKPKTVSRSNAGRGATPARVISARCPPDTRACSSA